MEHEYRKVLSALGADDVNHHGQTLTEHLIGTYRLLAKWGNSTEIAAAGAFHSIYGTEEFKTRAVSLDRRDEIASLIGQEAETLVYLFGMADRRSLYNIPNGHTLSVSLAGDNQRSLQITASQYQSLIEIEAANIVDQALLHKNVPEVVINYWKSVFKAKRELLSDGAAYETEKVLQKALQKNAI